MNNFCFLVHPPPNNRAMAWRIISHRIEWLFLPNNPKDKVLQDTNSPKNLKWGTRLEPLKII